MNLERRELRFIVSGQKVAKDMNCDFSNIVSGSKGYLVASFNFSREWKGFNKVAIFSVLGEKLSSVLNKSDKCVIPEDALVWSSFAVRVIGRSKDGKVLCTDNIIIDQKVVR